MEKPDYETFFRNYAATLNDCMAGTAGPDAVRASYAEYFVSAAAGGLVQGGANDEAYADVLKQGLAFYREIGLQRMTVLKVESAEIDGDHDMVRPFFRADYRRRDGAPVSIEFDLVYFLQRRPEGPKIFAFVAGDEMALYRRHGLVDESGRPPA